MIWFWLISCSDAPPSEKEKTTVVSQSKGSNPAPLRGPPKGHPHGHPKGGGLPKGGGPPGGMPHGKSALKVEPTFSWTGESDPNPKSIVIISLDTVRADRLSVYGGRAETPNLQKMADAGLVCVQAVTHFPETALSHWSMMTGVMPLVHGNVPGNGGSIYKGPTLAEIAKKHGYSTGAFIGGVTLTDSASGLSRGFDVYDDRFTFSQEDMSRKGSEVTSRALQWIQKQKQPYFAFVHYFDAHFPYTPPPPWDTKYDPTYRGSIDGTDRVLRPYRDGQKEPSKRDVEHVLALYDGEISALDETIQPLLDGIDTDTIVVVTSDHGESFEHGYYFNHRAGLWDSVLRIPLIVRAPGIRGGVEIQEQVGLIDLVPTIVELAGIRGDSRMQGTSMLPLISAEPKGDVVHYANTDPWMPNPQFSVRNLSWKWIQQERANLVYSIANDPEEAVLSNDIPNVFSQSQADYKALISSLKDQQVSTSQKRHISKEECARLEALGYSTCAE
ncbi:MAG: sulfatase [Myxococcota bacterium]|nr:sulfatase [Myxococcota bacterium]